MPASPRRSGSGSAPRDVAELLRSLAASPAPCLTWYGDGSDDRVELTGRVLVTWVAKTAHQLLEEADLLPGSSIHLGLGSDWRAPVFWLAATYLGADVVEGSRQGGRPPDVAVVLEGVAPAPAPTVTVVVPRSALPGPVADLPPGAVDHGDVAHHPDVLPPPGPSSQLRDVVPPGTPTSDGRVLRGPGTPLAELTATWAAGGTVVLHTGLDAGRLDRLARQERVTAP